MSDPLLVPSAENKLNDLNRKIAEIKKKIQLSEGQRKAYFEEHQAKRHENGEKIAGLKQEVKELYLEYAKTKNNEGRMEHTIHMNRESTSHGKKCNLGETIAKAEEGNVRLRKKLDLIKYEREKKRHKLNLLLQERNQITSGKIQKIFKKKLEKPLKSKIVKLEVRLEHVKMMQIKADIVRLKYESVRSDLKEKSVFYTSSLKDLENDMKEQENEIRRLQGVKKEAIELKDNMQETLIKEEVEITNATEERDAVLEDYRQRVQERKMELERLERMIFYARPRDDFDTRGKSHVQATEDITKDEVTRLEEAFAKLCSATGVSRSEDVLNRFLGQRATKDNLQKMRVATEQEKITLEKKRQELIAEMEMRKFSETKNAEQNAEEVDKLKRRTEQQRNRQENAEREDRKVRALLEEITGVLWRLCDKLRDIVDTLSEEPNNVNGQDPLRLIELINEKVESVIEGLGGQEKYLEILEEALIDKLETISIATTSAEGKTIRGNDGPLFPRFPSSATPATVVSEDEDDIPTRNVLKKQAQQIVDAKSRRKGFAFRR